MLDVEHQHEITARVKEPDVAGSGSSGRLRAKTLDQCQRSNSRALVRNLVRGRPRLIDHNNLVREDRLTRNIGEQVAQHGLSLQRRYDYRDFFACSLGRYRWMDQLSSSSEIGRASCRERVEISVVAV